MSLDRGAAGSPRPAAPRRLLFVTSAGCHFCAQSREVLDRLGGELGLEVAEIDLASPEGQDALARWRAPFPPFVVLDGELLGYGRLSERKLRAALAVKGA